MIAEPFLAHGVGGREDLPIPFSYALVGGVVALLVSFAVLGWLWRESRLRGPAAGRPVPAGVERVIDAPAFRWGLRVLGLVLTGFVAMAAFFGRDLASNPAATWVYVLFWVGLLPASLLFGPVWRQLNPIRTIHLGIARVLRTSPERGLITMPPGVGYSPAVISLLAFTWLELVAPDRTTTPVIRSFFAIYFVVHVLAATLFGRRWLDRGDGFEVYSSLVGLLSPLGRRRDGRLVVRNPFDGLDTLTPAPGLVAVVCVLLGSTAYDGFSNSPYWVRTTSASDLPPELLGTLGLLGFVATAYITYTLAAWLAGLFGGLVEGPLEAIGSVEGPLHYAGFEAGEPRSTAVQRTQSVTGDYSGPTRRELPALFAHSIVPIAVGYVIAHYFSLFLFEGQNALVLASDPLVNGSNWFGTAERGIDYGLVSAAAIAVVQVLAIILGHVLGVVAAHDRAVRLFPTTQAVAGQLPLLILMVGYTVGGLVLLFAG